MVKSLLDLKAGQTNSSSYTKDDMQPSQFTAGSPFTFDPLNATVEVVVQWVFHALPSPVILIRGGNYTHIHAHIDIHTARAKEEEFALDFAALQHKHRNPNSIYIQTPV